MFFKTYITRFMFLFVCIRFQHSFFLFAKKLLVRNKKRSNILSHTLQKYNVLKLKDKEP
jgi:hypothetical protein